jgi:hypothetical protein
VNLVSGEAKQNHKGSLNPVPEALKPREIDLQGVLIIRHQALFFSLLFAAQHATSAAQNYITHNPRAAI